MTVAFATFIPNKKQPLVLKFLKHLFETLDRKVSPHGSDASPDHTQIRKLETSGAVRQSVKPRVFRLRPFCARRDFVRRPQRVKINYAFWHKCLHMILKSPSPISVCYFPNRRRE